MAVTIDEMHVDVKQALAPSNTSPSTNAESKKDVDLREALHALYERELRLKAD
jgi:hypothetical protein